MDVLRASEAEVKWAYQNVRDTRNTWERAQRAWKRVESEETRKALDEAGKARNAALRHLNKLHAPKQEEEEWTYQTYRDARNDYFRMRHAWKKLDSKHTRKALDEARKAMRLALQHPDNIEELLEERRRKNSRKKERKVLDPEWYKDSVEKKKLGERIKRARQREERLAMFGAHSG